MNMTFPYGSSSECRLALDDCTHLAAERHAHPPVADPIGAVRRALAEPQGYPPLATATVPGDRVVLALGVGVPQPHGLLLGAVAAVVDAGVEPTDITIVSTAKIEDRDRLEQELAVAGSTGVRFEVHDPDDEPAIAMVGVTSAGTPLRLNRTIAEADLVVPIGVSQTVNIEGLQAPKFSGLFPQFSDRDTQDLFQAGKDETPKQLAKRIAAIDEAGWLLGIGMTVSVVPGAGGAVAAVLAGEPAAVAKVADERRRAIWEREAKSPGDLVVAAVLGDQREQTWDNLGAALRAAERVLLPDGVIAVLTELSEPPPETFDRLREAVDFEDVQRVLARETGEGVAPALALAHALERGPVYLRSRLPADLVESIGMTPIESDAELSRLAAGRDHTVVIEEAQRIVPRLSSANARP